MVLLAMKNMIFFTEFDYLGHFSILSQKGQAILGLGGVGGGRVGIKVSREEWGRGGEVEAVQSGAVFYPRKRCKSLGVGGVGEWVGGD